MSAVHNGGGFISQLIKEWLQFLTEILVIINIFISCFVIIQINDD